MAGWRSAFGDRRWRAPSVLATAAVVVGLAWWWGPALTGRGDGTDVLVVGTGDVATAEGHVVRRLREQGLSVEVADAPADWCTASAPVASAVSTVDPRVVVIGLRDLGRCGDDPVADVLAVLDAAGVDVVLVSQPGTAEVAVGRAGAAAGVVVADPSRLLGEGDLPRSAPCQWWDVGCPVGGEVEVRDVTGRLTAAGIQRVARVVAAEIR